MKRLYFILILFAIVTIAFAQQKQIDNAVSQGKNTLGAYTMYPNMEVNKLKKWFSDNTKWMLVGEIETKELKEFGYLRLMAVKADFIPKSEEGNYKNAIEKKSLGLDNSYTILWNNAGCLGNVAFLAYHFVGNTGIEFRKKSCLAVDFAFNYVTFRGALGQPVYYGTDYLSYDLAEVCEKLSVSPSCFDEGVVPMLNYASKEVKYIKIPKYMLDYRDSLYAVASKGTIYDLLKYEDTYKSIDGNTKALQGRKNKMLYTTEYFDAQSEKYKNDLYKKTYQEATTWELKNAFREKYAQYDPQQYIATIPPLEIAKKLASYQNLAIADYNFVEDYRINFLDIFQSGKRVNETLYNNKKAEIQNAINSCTKDINDYPNYSTLFSDVLSQLNDGVRRIDSRYAEAKAYVRRLEEIGKRLEAERCANCELDKEKSKLPSFDPNLWNSFREQTPGKLVMKNGDEQEFYWEKDEKCWYTESGFIFTSKTKFENLDDLYATFYKKCIETHCK